MATASDKSMLNTVKVWLFPSVLSILCVMLYDDIREIKSDVKQLLAQAASDHTEIINLKSQVNLIDNKVFTFNSPKDSDKNKFPPSLVRTDIALIHQDNNKLNIKKKDNKV